MTEEDLIGSMLSNASLVTDHAHASIRTLQIPEILRMVLSIVGEQAPRQDLLAACQVNHFWNEIASEICWQSCCAKAILDPSRIAPRRRQFYADRIEEMTCFSWTSPFSEALADLHFPRMRRLTIEFQGKQELDEELCQFLQNNCPHLQLLKLSPPIRKDRPASTHLQQFFLCLQTKGLSPQHRTSQEQRNVEIISTNATHESLECSHADNFLPLRLMRHFHMKELRLGQTLSASFIRDFIENEDCQPMSRLEPHTFKYLEVIDLHMCHNYIRILAPLLTSIRSLEITLLDHGDGALELLCSLPTLRSFEIYFSKSATLASKDFRLLANLSDLETLHLHDHNPRSALFDALTPQDFYYTISRLPRLTSLRLKLKENSTLRSHDFRLFATLPKLRHLHLYDDDPIGALFSELSPQDFEDTVKCLPKLESFGLHAHRNASVSLKSIREMGLVCTSLKYCLLAGPVLAEDPGELEGVLPNLDAWAIAPFSVLWSMYQ